MKSFVKILCLALVMMLTAGVAAFAEDNTLVVGTNPEFAPFEFVNDAGEIAGMDVDIIKAIGEKIGMTVTVEAMDFDALIPSLVSGKIDAAIAGMTITEERKKSVLFADPYYDATQVVIVNADNPAVASAAELDGKKIGVQLGTTGDLYATETYPNAEISRFNKGIDAAMDVKNGKLDAVVIDEMPAQVFASNLGSLTIINEQLSSEQYGIALPQGQEELLAKINAALAEMVADGSLLKIVEAYQ